MRNIENNQIRRDAKSLQMVHNFSDYDFTEIAGKLQFEAGYSKDDAERLTIEMLRKRCR